MKYKMSHASGVRREADAFMNERGWTVMYAGTVKG